MVESTLTGTIDGQIEQSVITQGLEMDTDNTTYMLFSKMENETTTSTIDSWNSSWVDVNNDGWDDLYVTTYDKNRNQITCISITVMERLLLFQQEMLLLQKEELLLLHGRILTMMAIWMYTMHIILILKMVYTVMKVI